MMRLIALKELRGLLAAPSSWLILAVLQFVFAWFFLSRLDAFLQVQAQLAQLPSAIGATQAVVAPMFNVLALLLLVLTPLLTMRLLAEERRNHTFPLLLSAPVSAASIVLGKFCGLMAFLALVMLICVATLMTLAAGTHLDMGMLLGNVIGIFMLVASYAALGLYVSSLVAQPMAAALGALAALFGLWLASVSMAESRLQIIAPNSHFSNFNAGLLDSADAVYLLLFCGVFLALTIWRVGGGRQS